MKTQQCTFRDDRATGANDECLLKQWVGQSQVNFSLASDGVVIDDAVMVSFYHLFVCQRGQVIPSLFVALIEKNPIAAENLFRYLEGAFEKKQINFNPNIFINQLVYGLSLAGKFNTANAWLRANSVVCGYHVETREHRYSNGWDCIRDAILYSVPVVRFRVEEKCPRDGLDAWFSEGRLEYYRLLKGKGKGKGKGKVTCDVGDLDEYLSGNVFTPEEQRMFAGKRSLIAPLNPPPVFRYIMKVENRPHLVAFYQRLNYNSRKNLIQMILFWVALKGELDSLDQLMADITMQPVCLFTPDRLDWKSMSKERQDQNYSWLKMMLFAVAQAGDGLTYKKTYYKIQSGSEYYGKDDMLLQLHAVMYAAYGGHVTQVYSLLKEITKSTAFASVDEEVQDKVDKFIKNCVIGALRQVGCFLDSYSRQLILPLLRSKTLLTCRTFAVDNTVVMRLCQSELRCAVAVSRLNPQNLLSLSPQQMNLFFMVSGTDAFRWCVLSFLVELSMRLPKKLPHKELFYEGKRYHHPLLTWCFSSRLSRMTRFFMAISVRYKNSIERRIEHIYQLYNDVMGNRVLACLIWGYLSDISIQSFEDIAAKGVFSTELKERPSLKPSSSALESPKSVFFSGLKEPVSERCSFELHIGQP